MFWKCILTMVNLFIGNLFAKINWPTKEKKIPNTLAFYSYHLLLQQSLTVIIKITKEILNSITTYFIST